MSLTVSLPRSGQTAGAERGALAFCELGWAERRRGFPAYLSLKKQREITPSCAFVKEIPPNKKEHIRLKTCSFLLGAFEAVMSVWGLVINGINEWDGADAWMRRRQPPRQISILHRGDLSVSSGWTKVAHVVPFALEQEFESTDRSSNLLPGPPDQRLWEVKLQQCQSRSLTSEQLQGPHRPAESWFFTSSSGSYKYVCE